MITADLLPADRRRAAALVKHVLATDEQGVAAILRETVEAGRTAQLIGALAQASALISIGTCGSRELAVRAWGVATQVESLQEAASQQKGNTPA